jgi:flagellar hook-associated protein 1 FlgK
MGILNIGTTALNANLVALQTIGNNIANVNTAGYSRQNAIQGTVLGQFTGAGYVGKGVSIETIQRSYSDFLTRQSTLAAATQASDQTRSNQLAQLSTIFEGGTDGIGASINDMLNAFSDVASSPTDLTARTVALTRIDETARRLRAASQSLDDLQSGVSQSLAEKVKAVNTLAQNIADVNGQIARVQGNGQPPNDLLDKRDQLILNLNQYVQTSSIPASDGTVGVYIGGSQALVLGTSASKLSIDKNEFGDANQSKLFITQAGASSSARVVMDENQLGGGEISGLLRFQNNDLVEGRNLLGRLTTTVTTRMNEQHALGLDLNGQPGGDLFSQVSVNNILVPKLPATVNSAGVTVGTGAATDLTLAISQISALVGSDYQVNVIAANQVTITRLSDGASVPIDPATPTVPHVFDPTDLSTPITFDGLTLTNLNGAQAGDRFYLKPFASAASDIQREFSTPAALAVSSSIVGAMGSTNTGSLQLSSLAAGVKPTLMAAYVPVTITFTAATATTPASYTRSDVGGSTPFKSGDKISGGGSPSAWTLVLQGAPKDNDTFTVKDITTSGVDRSRNGGNATALMDLRDEQVFDGSPLSDGYASLMSQIGVRAQSANYTATVSTNIATNAQKELTGVTGVNLDEEAAKLLQYQQAYQASAKMIQIAQSIFDTLIQTLAR